VRAGHAAPVGIIVSGRAAPTLPHQGPVAHTFDDTDFRAHLRHLGGTPAEVLDHEAMMEFLLPTLRSDFAVGETYVYPGGETLPCPLIVYGGEDDPLVSREALAMWREQTRAAFSLRMFPGGHFYLNDSDAFFPALNEDLARLWAEYASPWRAPPQEIHLEAGEIHLWRADLEVPDDALARFQRVLSPEEQKRADAFFFERDRRRFAASHGFLRHVLARYLKIPAAQVEIRSGHGGKPEIGQGSLTPDSRLLTPDVQFNLSHSGPLALVGVTRGRAIGVDVEWLRPMPDAGQLAARYFTAAEQRVLQALPPDEHVHGFFRCWTRKEAYLKARGLGLAMELDRFEVSCAPGEPASLLWVEDAPAEPDRWRLIDVPLGSEAVGACAVEQVVQSGDADRLLFWQENTS
jgi:4'-phosphopantetheinyl transferase